MTRTSAATIGGDHLYALWTDASVEEGSDEFERLDAFYSDVHIGEVLRENPGFVTAVRGGRVSPATGTGYAAARWTALYGVHGEAGIQAYAARNASGPAPLFSALPPLFPHALRGQGRGLYRRVAAAGDAPAAGRGNRRSAALVLIARGTDEDPPSLEALRRGGGIPRAGRYQLIHDLNAEGTSSPRVMDLLEADSIAAATDLAGAELGRRAIVYEVLAGTDVPADPVAARP